MTIAMPDSIVPASMPRGYRAYLAYVDGARSEDAATVRAMFAGAEILTLTVLGGNAVADGCDRETGDLSPASAAAWLHWRISSGQVRPVLYDSRDDVISTLGQLAAVGVQREQVRILSAHYGAGEHICGKATCGAPFEADGTQWTSSFPGVGGALIDMSALNDDFFGAPAAPAPAPGYTWTEFDMTRLPVLKEGDADRPGSFWYVRRCQSLVSLTGHINGLAAAIINEDGSYGPLTADGVKAVQAHYGIAQDGVCGPATWSVLLTGAA